MSLKTTKKKRRRFMLRRKRTLDPSIVIDYKNIDTLKRFVTDRGKVIPRRISGATASQQRLITMSVKRARFLSLLPFSVNHKQERSFLEQLSYNAYESRMAHQHQAHAAAAAARSHQSGGRDDDADSDEDQ